MKALIFGVVTALFSFQVYACSCMDGYPSATDVLEENHSVFLGIPAEDSKSAGTDLLKTKFTVIRNFKNTPSGTQHIFTDVDNGGNCGVDFKGNQGVMLVQTEKVNGKVWSNYCSVDALSNENTELTRLIRKLAAATGR